jgi:hypothetical protein
MSYELGIFDALIFSPSFFYALPYALRAKLIFPAFR